MAQSETSGFTWLFSDHQSKLKKTILGAQASSPWWVSTVSSLRLSGNFRCWVSLSIGQRKSDPESLKPFHVQHLLLPFLKGQGEDEITHSLDDWQLHILKYTHARTEQQSKSRTVFNLRIASDRTSTVQKSSLFQGAKAQRPWNYSRNAVVKVMPIAGKQNDVFRPVSSITTLVDSHVLGGWQPGLHGPHAYLVSISWKQGSKLARQLTWVSEQRQVTSVTSKVAKLRDVEQGKLS